MRIIKFRAWHIKLKKYLKIVRLEWGILPGTNERKLLSIVAIYEIDDREVEIIGEPGKDFILEQFTNLYDSTKWNKLSKEEKQKWLDNDNKKEDWKGKEIYEGDILKIDGGGEPFYAEVIFENGCFAIKAPWIETRIKAGDKKEYPELKMYIGMNFCKTIVAGNIQENPERIKK